MNTENIITFDKKIAIECGVNCAIVFEYIKKEIIENSMKKRMFTQGKYWMSKSMDEMSLDIFFLTLRQVRASIKILVDNQLLIKNNFNDHCMDKTNWYTIR